MPHGRRRRFTDLVQSFGIVFSPEQAVIVQETLRGYEETKEVFVITYPQTGGTHTFPAGTTMVDFYEGKIVFADGSEDDLPNNLKSLDEAWMQSFFIETDQTINVSMEDERNFYQVIQGDYLGLTYQQFQRIYIKTTQDTNIQLWATTHSDAMLSKLKADSARAAAIYRRLTGALDLSVLKTLTTSFTMNYELAGVWVHFDAVVTLTVQLIRISTLGDDYKTVMRSIDLVAGQDIYIEFAKGEGRIRSGDFIQLSIGASPGRFAYCDITTEDV